FDISHTTKTGSPEPDPVTPFPHSSTKPGRAPCRTRGRGILIRPQVRPRSLLAGLPILLRTGVTTGVLAPARIGLLARARVRAAALFAAGGLATVDVPVEQFLRPVLGSQRRVVELGRVEHLVGRRVGTHRLVVDADLARLRIHRRGVRGHVLDGEDRAVLVLPDPEPGTGHGRVEPGQRGRRPPDVTASGAPTFCALTSSRRLRRTSRSESAFSLAADTRAEGVACDLIRT